MRFRNKYRGRGIPMFVWLPTVVGTIFAIMFICWMDDTMKRRATERICYQGRVIEGVVTCDDAQ